MVQAQILNNSDERIVISFNTMDYKDKNVRYI